MAGKMVYPVVFKENKGDKVPFYVYVPDLGCATQGTDFADAIEMARDVINLTIVDMEDEKKAVPVPGSVDHVLKDGEFISYVDVDPVAYRIRLKNLSVRKNCTLPQWLACKAEEAGINFSKVLQEALTERLGLGDTMYG